MARGRLDIDTLIAIVLGGFTVVMKWWPVSVGSDTGPSDRVVAIANAIAFAEGFQDINGNKKAAGSIPVDRHNPGDITDLTGIVKTYASDADGWSALYDYVQRMIDGTFVYNQAQTWNKIGGIYSGTPGGPWTRNVTAALGVDPNSTLGDYINA